MAGIYSLKGVVKHYDWGGTAYIPALLSTSNAEKKPFAEYWLGIHPLGAGQVDTGGTSLTPLPIIAPDLPYLLKVLDVKNMLSIQVHPSKATAEAEFARENDEGIPLESPLRSYKDDNHKPELMVALSDFWLLHGFKPTEALVDILINVTALNELLPVFQQKGYAGLYQWVMEMPQDDVDRILKPLIDELVVLYNENKLEKSTEDFWAARAALTFDTNQHIDRGIFSIYLFNLVHLQKGEGIFQAAGVPHAYLEGQNVEIMANSDNVLRGGLTTKNIDVEQLLKNVQAEPTFPRILQVTKTEAEYAVYPTSVDDFQLAVCEMEAGDIISYTPQSVEILLLTDGKVEGSPR